MAHLAFLGAGAMGSRMAMALLESGASLSVWNRTPDRLAPLIEAGAVRAATPREAADGAEAVFSMVRDDAASERVWLDPQDGALAGLSPAAVGVECSTLSLGQIGRLAEAFERAERVLIDAPVAGSRPQAEARALIFLAGGSATALETVRPSLESMGGAVHHAGRVGAGMTVKLMVNALFGVQLATMAELIGFAGKVGIEAATAIEILGATPVCSAAAKGGAQAMLAGAFSPSFPLDLVAKDFRVITESASAALAATPVSDAAGRVYERALAKGFGADNITGVAQLYSPA